VPMGNNDGEGLWGRGERKNLFACWINNNGSSRRGDSIGVGCKTVGRETGEGKMFLHTLDYKGVGGIFANERERDPFISFVFAFFGQGEKSLPRQCSLCSCSCDRRGLFRRIFFLTPCKKTKMVYNEKRGFWRKNNLIEGGFYG